MNPLWSWVLTFIGIACFWLAGRKVWWAWFVGIAGQFVWLAYSLLSGQWGFLAGVVLYTVVYVGNAVRWTREHRQETVEEVHARLGKGGFAQRTEEGTIHPETGLIDVRWRKEADG